MKQSYLTWMFAFLLSINLTAQENMLSRTEPEFTTVDRLIQLSAGMTKDQVLATLEVYPYDILYNQENQCEIHIVKYAVTKRKFVSRIDEPGTKQQLDDGQPYYDNINEVAIYYRNGVLEAYIVESLEKTTYELLNYDAFIAEQCNPTAPVMKEPEPEVISGCMDPNSINYNAEATEDDGSCEYCECGYVKTETTNELEKNTCPPCIPSQELWSYWLQTKRCDLISTWVETYPKLINSVPVGFFDSCMEVEEVVTEECDWCNLIEKSGAKVELHAIEVELKNTQE